MISTGCRGRAAASVRVRDVDVGQGPPSRGPEHGQGSATTQDAQALAGEDDHDEDTRATTHDCRGEPLGPSRAERRSTRRRRGRPATPRSQQHVPASTAGHKERRPRRRAPISASQAATAVERREPWPLPCWSLPSCRLLRAARPARSPRLRRVRGDGLVEGREEVVRVDGAGQLVALDLLAHRVLHLGEDQRDPALVQPRVQVLEHVRGRRVDVRDRLGGDDDPPQRRVAPRPSPGPRRRRSASWRRSGARRSGRPPGRAAAPPPGSARCRAARRCPRPGRARPGAATRRGGRR